MSDTNRDFIIAKTIKNTTSADMFLGDVLLYELKSLGEIGLDRSSRVFVSKRQKNDMPCIVTLGKNDASMREATTRKGLKRKIVSDHLTIIGSRQCFAIGLTDGSRNLIRTEIRLDTHSRFAGLKVYAEVNTTLKPNQKIKLGAVSFCFSDDINTAIKSWVSKRAQGVALKERKCPSVFCTWYYYGATVNFEDCVTNLNKIKEKRLLFEVFQIDDGWEKSVGEWTNNAKFPPLKEVASKINSFGLIAGIWSSPFIASKSAAVWQKHPTWLLRNTAGKPCVFHVNGTDFYIFDITVPDTWQYFESMYATLVAEGFGYHKLDFTRAPLTAKKPNYANKYLTPVQCYKMAFEHIRRGLQDSFLLVCGGLYDPLIGIADAARTGRDVNAIYGGAFYPKTKTLPYTVKQSLLRCYMNAFWYNDPDSLMIRQNKKPTRGGRLSLGLLSDDEALLATANQVFSGGLISATEPLDKIGDDRLAYYRHILPRKDVTVEVADLSHAPYCPNKIRVLDNANANSIYFVYVNLGGKNTSVNISVKEIVYNGFCTEQDVLEITEFFSQKTYSNLNLHSEITVQNVKRHSCLILRLTKDVGMPYDRGGHFIG